MMIYKRLFVFFGLLFVLGGCGYDFAANAPLALPENMRKLHIVKVDDVSTEEGLRTTVRNLVHDEFTRRGQIQWVGREQAEGLVYLSITQFLGDDITKGEDDITLKSSFTVTLSMTIKDAKTGAILFESGPVSGSESYFAKSNNAAKQRAITRAVQNLADRLSHYNF